MNNAYATAKDDLLGLSKRFRASEDGWDTAKGDGLAEALEHLLRGKETGLSEKEAMMYAGEKIFGSLRSVVNDPAYRDGLLEGMDIIYEEFRIQYSPPVGILPDAYKE